MTKAAPKTLALMDKVHAFTFKDKHQGKRLTPDTLEVQRTIRSKLRAAKRFSLDDDAVRLICSLSYQFDRLEAWSLLARMPHEPLWIEYNNFAKLHTFQDLGVISDAIDPSMSPELRACLLYRDTNTGDRWVCQSFEEYGSHRPMLVTPIAYVFDPDGDPQSPARGSDFWNKPTLSLRKGFPRATMRLSSRAKLGEPPVVANYNCDPEIVLAGLSNMTDATAIATAAPDWLTPRMAAIVDPWWDAQLAGLEASNPEQWQKLLMSAVEAEKAQLRWIIVMLAAINGLPNEIQHNLAAAGKHSVGMNSLPFFEYSTMSLTIQRDDQLLTARKLLNSAVRRHNRRHTVMGHWRVVDRRPVTHLCRHMPAMVEHGLGVCERCEMLIRWIEQHERGDASLGVVDHDYKITSSAP